MFTSSDSYVGREQGCRAALTHVDPLQASADITLWELLCGERCVYKLGIPSSLSLFSSVSVCLLSSFSCVQLSNASLSHMAYETRKWPAIFSLAALVGSGWVIAIVPEPGIKGAVAPEPKQAVRFRDDLPAAEARMRTCTDTHILTREKQRDSSTAMSELRLCG